MTSTYTRGNRYSARISIADAAVDWQNLDAELQAKVVLNDQGLPVLQGCVDLLERAEGILIAASSGLISGLVRNEDGDSYRPAQMQLDRASLAEWIADIEKKLAINPTKKPLLGTDSPERLLKLSEVLERLNMSESTFKRRRKEGLFAEPTHQNPYMWPEGAITAYLARMVIDKAAKAPDGDI
jgi:predicted DNA-binding transcriptional regulator AlpA